MSNQSGIIPIFVILSVILVGLVGGGIIYTQFYLTKTTDTTKTEAKSFATSIPLPTAISSPTSQPSLSPQASSTPPSSAINPNNWKTYEGNGMTFKYPGNGSVGNGGSAVYIMNIGEPYFIFSVGISENPKHLNSEQAAQEIIEDLRNNPNAPWLKGQADQMSKTKKVYNRGVIQGTQLQSFFEGDPSGFGEVLYTTNDKIYSFIIHNGDGYVEKSEEEMLDKILSSLKFTK